MGADAADPARHWLTRRKRVDEDSPSPLPIEEEVEAKLADLRAHSGHGSDAEAQLTVPVSELKVAIIESLLEEFAARLRRQVETGEVEPVCLRLAELNDAMIRELRLASGRAGLA